MVLREADVRITTGKHFGYVPMGNTEAAGEMLNFSCEERVGRRLSYQPPDRSAVAGARSRLDRIRLRDASTGPPSTMQTVLMF